MRNNDSFLDYVFLGLFGTIIAAGTIATLPITLPLYAIGRWVVAPLMDWLGLWARYER